MDLTVVLAWLLLVGLAVLLAILVGLNVQLVYQILRGAR